MSSEQPASSLQAGIDTVTGYVQQGIAAVAGSTGDQVSLIGLNSSTI